jgi:hypothetical protein
MDPAHLIAIRESLRKACGFVKPQPAALEAFASNLIKLLNTQGQQSEAQAQTYLLAILPAACFAPDEEESPGNSSPVCYAHVSGLREGFQEAGIPEPPANRITANTGLREALHAALYSVRQVLSAAPGSPPANNTIIEKQLTAFVYQLFGLSPEEIAAFGRPVVVP